MAAAVGGMEKEALERRERLKAMRISGKAGTQGLENNSVLRVPVFRSYKPQTESLQGSVIPAPKLKQLEEKLTEQLGDIDAPSDSLPQGGEDVEEIDITELAPRKPDWDLKRDITKKINKLKQRTDRAIAELIRERLQATAAESSDLDLAGAVEAAGRTDLSDED